MENPFKKTAEKVKNEEIAEDKLQEEAETAEDSSDNKETAFSNSSTFTDL